MKLFSVQRLLATTLTDRAVWSKRLRRAQRASARRLPDCFLPVIYWVSPMTLRMARRLQTSRLFAVGDASQGDPLLRGEGLQGYVAAAESLGRDRMAAWRHACSQALARTSDAFPQAAEAFLHRFEAAQYLATDTRSWARRKSFVVAVHSNSPADILGIAEAVATALSAAGASCEVVDERACGQISDHDYAVVIAPQIFFLDDATASLRSKSVIRRLVLYNTEPLGSVGFLSALPYLMRARAVLDVGFHASEALRGRLAATHMPPPFDGAAVAASLARVDLSHPLLRWAGRDEFLSSVARGRFVDLIFRGPRSPRLGRLLIQTASYLASKMCVIDYHLDPKGVSKRRPEEIADRARASLDAGVALGVRSRVRLNAHTDQLAPLDWQGSYAQGLACGACVITSPVLPSPFLQPGIHYIESSTRNLDKTIAWSLDDADGQAQASDAGRAGQRVAYEVLTAQRIGQYALTFLRGLK